MCEINTELKSRETLVTGVGAVGIRRTWHTLVIAGKPFERSRNTFATSILSIIDFKRGVTHESGERTRCTRRAREALPNSGGVGHHGIRTTVDSSLNIDCEVLETATTVGSTKNKSLLRGVHWINQTESSTINGRDRELESGACGQPLRSYLIFKDDVVVALIQHYQGYVDF